MLHAQTRLTNTELELGWAVEAHLRHFVWAVSSPWKLVGCASHAMTIPSRAASHVWGNATIPIHKQVQIASPNPVRSPRWSFDTQQPQMHPLVHINRAHPTSIEAFLRVKQRSQLGHFSSRKLLPYAASLASSCLWPGILLGYPPGIPWAPAPNVGEFGGHLVEAGPPGSTELLRRNLQLGWGFDHGSYQLDPRGVLKWMGYCWLILDDIPTMESFFLYFFEFCW